MDAYLKDQLDFTGVKVALLVEKSILVVLRDNKPDIPWPNMWELPGGGREGIETPLECLQREVWEELGLTLKEESKNRMSFLCNHLQRASCTADCMCTIDQPLETACTEMG